MKFDIVIDDILSVLIGQQADTSTVEKRKLILALVNDFEDKAWRYGAFSEFIWNNIAETSLSARERLSLADQSATALRRSAMNLRLTDSEKDVGRGSEIAEIVMYGVMKHHYQALPVVPKIFYKQNKNDNAKGADSVHIVLAKDNNDFSLWFGESKFYSDISDARLEKVVVSVSDLLTTGKIKKENSIIVGLSDLDELICHDSLRTKIRDALDGSRSIDKLKARIHIPILLLYECAITSGAKAITDSYLSTIREVVRDRAFEYFKRQSAKLSNFAGYDDIHFHLIVFPVPNKAKIVDEFIALANALKGSGT